jgi:hypothetical protein
MSLSLTKEQRDIELRLFAVLRDLQVEAQNIVQLLDDIELKSKSADAQARPQIMQATILSSSRIYDPNKAQISELISTCRQMLEQETVLHAWYGDKFTEIENLWERADQDWIDWSKKARKTQPNGDEILAQISQTKQWLDALEYRCSELTVPDRVNQKLRYLKDGNALDFNGEFKQELPNEDRLKALLSYIHSHPLLIEGGTVNVEQGAIYRTSRSLRQRIGLPLILIAAAFGIGLVINGGMYGLGWLLKRYELPTTGWPILDTQTFISASVMYLFILIGGVAHLVVNALKEVRSGQTSNSLVLKDWLLWVQINKGPLIKAIMFLGAALIGFLFTFGTDESGGWLTAFLVGYTADSFVDLFLKRFETFGSEKAKAMENTLKT